MSHTSLGLDLQYFPECVSRSRLCTSGYDNLISNLAHPWAEQVSVVVTPEVCVTDLARLKTFGLSVMVARILTVLLSPSRQMPD